MIHTGKVEIEEISDQLEEISGEFYSEIIRIEERYRQRAEKLVEQGHGLGGEDLRKFWRNEFIGTCGTDYARSYEPLASFAKTLRDRAQNDNCDTKSVRRF